MGRVLVIGYGNPARGDDGLGPAAAEELERMAFDGVTVDANYQLTVEDAQSVAEHDVVVFVDAAMTGPEPFLLQSVEPRRPATYHSHSLEPSALLALAMDVFRARTEGYLLGIRGYEFGTFEEGLSERAQANLGCALRFLEPYLRARRFDASWVCQDEAVGLG